jgi:hypothetical protein
VHFCVVLYVSESYGIAFLFQRKVILEFLIENAVNSGPVKGSISAHGIACSSSKTHTFHFQETVVILSCLPTLNVARLFPLNSRLSSCSISRSSCYLVKMFTFMKLRIDYLYNLNILQSHVPSIMNCVMKRFLDLLWWAQWYDRRFRFSWIY